MYQADLALSPVKLCIVDVVVKSVSKVFIYLFTVLINLRLLVVAETSGIFSTDSLKILRKALTVHIQNSLSEALVTRCRVNSICKLQCHDCGK